MFDYQLIVISCICTLHIGACDEDCGKTIIARRQVFKVPAGGSLSLSCVVRHCGHNWTGNWVWRNATEENYIFLKATAKHQLMRVTLSEYETRLVLKMPTVNQSEEGYYGCTVTWGGGESDHGHWMYVNVTAAVSSQRDVLPRILICGGSFLCLPIILGVARCLSSQGERQPPPGAEFTYAAVHKAGPPRPPPRQPLPQKRNFSPRKGAVPLQFQQNSEVVYADISQDSLMQQEATGEPVQSTVYSMLKFP